MIVNLMMWKIMAKFKKRRNLRELTKVYFYHVPLQVSLHCRLHSTAKRKMIKKKKGYNNNPNPFHSKEENDANVKKAKESAATDKASLDQRQTSPGY